MTPGRMGALPVFCITGNIVLCDTKPTEDARRHFFIGTLECFAT